jgi:PncC family amidohydrolase
MSLYGVASICLSNQITLSFAESVTGGHLMAALVSIKGISKVFRGGIVCYQEEVKIETLKVSPDLLEKYTAESIQTSIALIQGLKNLIPAQLLIGITGLASDGNSSSGMKPPGSIYLAIEFQEKVHTFKTVLNGNRNQILEKACIYAFEKIYQVLTNDETGIV